MPCSLVQRTCWFLDRISPGTASFNISVRFNLTGALDTALLEQALREICRRHEVLRTHFEAKGGEPLQVVSSLVDFDLPLIDLSTVPAGQREAQAESLAAEEANIGFDVAHGPLFRGKLLRTSQDQHTLLLTMHHIISDGWSVGIVTDEMGQIYEALVAGQPSALAPLPIQYGDYAYWQQQWISTGELDRHIEELRCRLDGFEPLKIPTDFKRPAVASSQGQISSRVLPRQLTDSLQQFSEQHGCTLFVTMLSAFFLLLKSQSGQDELVIRTQTAGRDRIELEGLIGWFVNSIILRGRVTGDPVFEDLVREVSTLVIESFDYQQIPFERLMEVIRPGQAPQRHPPFQVNFIFQRDFVRPWERGGIVMTPIPSKATGTFVDLNFFLVERKDGWRASIDVNTDVFDPKTGEFLLDCFQKILTAVARSPLTKLSAIALPPRPFPGTPVRATETFWVDNFVPARNEHEEAVIEIWKKVLNVSKVGAYTNFFDLGGHSLKAVRLLSEFQQRFGLEIKMSELFVDPTPAAMAQIISGEADYSDARELIPIQANGTRPPFFMIGGDHWFRPLAMAAGLDQPFFGVPLLRYRALDIGKERVSIAKELAGILISQHPGAEFCVGGWCADGLTAYEVARALKAAGEKVSLVVLFDTMNPEYYTEARSLVHAAGRTFVSLRSLFRTAIDAGLRSGLPALLKSLKGVVDRLLSRIGHTLKEGYKSAPASFPVLVLRPVVTSTLEQPDLGWRRACQDALTVVEVPGDHSSIFREPNVKVLGWKLREQLDAAFNGKTARAPEPREQPAMVRSARSNSAKEGDSF